MEQTSFSPMPTTRGLTALYEQIIAKDKKIDETKSLAWKSLSEAHGAGCVWQRKDYKQNRSGF